jgi:hypothetical protein
VFDDLSESIESEGGMFVRRDKNEYYLVFIVRTDCASHQWLDVLSVRLCVRANRIRTRTGRLCVRANRGKHATHPLGAVRDRCSGTSLGRDDTVDPARAGRRRYRRGGAGCHFSLQQLLTSEA